MHRAIGRQHDMLVWRKVPWLKRDEGIATVVLRVAQALGKSVPLERQAFSVGVGEDKPESLTVALPNWKDIFERAGIKQRPAPGGD